MGHDIYGFNKAGEEIAYLRFGAWNLTASVFYNLLDANEYNAGVSGSGNSTTFSKRQLEKALSTYEQMCWKSNSRNGFDHWEQKEILSFLAACLETAKKEESVRVVFC